ncbi:MAG TPA: M1 family aminopeptidase [Candidatus Acidoferrum sp.]|nr:M1 family aminopeptidase [Candidatus Acidoferrum sp.]
MKPLLTRLAFILTVTCLVSLTTTLVAAQAGDSQIDWSTATPAQIHQHMWESKARSLSDKNLYRQLATAAPLVNTQTNYDVKFYDISIRVNDTTQILWGRIGMTAASTQSGVNQIQIDYYSSMTVDSIIAPSGPLSYTRSGDVVTLTLDRAYDAGEQFSFYFWYHGHPPAGGFQAFTFDTRSDGKPIISSLSEPYLARTWWPCKDRPDDKADSFKIAIECDTSFYCGSNGTLDSIIQRSNNSHIFYYTEHYAMTTYLFSVACSPYTVWHDWYRYNSNKDSMLITHAVYPTWYSYSLTHFNIVPQAIALLAQTYGQYPFITEKYGHSNFDWGGGMEHQTMTSMEAGSFGFSEPVVVHELSHQWWGDMVTCDSWHHIWLNEGFASYSEALYYLNRDGWSHYHSYMNGMAYESGGTIYISDTTNVYIIFGSIVYDKGAWVVHMLRRILGEAGFAAVIQAYYNSPYKFGSATTEQFRDLAEAVSGKDLHPFFQDWIYGTYYPTYLYYWMSEAAPGGGYNTYLVVNQTQTTNPQVFHMPVDFSFDYTLGTPDTLHLDCGARKSLFKFHTPNNVTQIQLDPQGWVLGSEHQNQSLWTFSIITLPSEVSSGTQYVAYTDTLQARTGTSFAWNIASGALPTGFTINNKGIIAGTTSDTGTFTFFAKVRNTSTNAVDSAQYSIHIAPHLILPGDMNLDGTVDISDMSILIDYLFLGGQPPVVKNTADVDASCAIDISDISYMVDFLFFAGPGPKMGCIP